MKNIRIYREQLESMIQYASITVLVITAFACLSIGHKPDAQLESIEQIKQTRKEVMLRTCWKDGEYQAWVYGCEQFSKQAIAEADRAKNISAKLIKE